MLPASFKTKLKPNNKQATLFAKHAGTARHAKMPLKNRTFNCECCGMTKDRDFNASVNLENYIPAVSSTVAACGDSQVTANRQCESVKQEIDINLAMSKIV